MWPRRQHRPVKDTTSQMKMLVSAPPERRYVLWASAADEEEEEGALSGNCASGLSYERHSTSLRCPRSVAITTPLM